MPDSKTGCYAYVHDLIGLLRCRIYIMLYRYYYGAVMAQDSLLVNSCLIPTESLIITRKGIKPYIVCMWYSEKSVGTSNSSSWECAMLKGICLV